MPNNTDMVADDEAPIRDLYLRILGHREIDSESSEMMSWLVGCLAIQQDRQLRPPCRSRSCLCPGIPKR
jgi:hypothetical protein